MLRRSIIAGIPRASAWNVTPAKLRAATTQAASLGFKGDKRIEFLCAKDVDAGFLRKESRFDLITQPPKGDKEWQKRQDTLHGILGMKTRGPRVSHDEKTIPRNISFAAFCKKHPEWADRNNSFVFFRDHPHFRRQQQKHVLIQREQVFGTCAIHAPVVLQHYLVAMANRGVTPTVDIPKWLRRHAPKAVLDGVVFGKGTNTDQVLRAILLPGSSLRDDVDQIGFDSVLRNHGPLLLPMWEVTDEFYDTTKWLHVGRSAKSAARDPEYHSMLAVGHRRTQSGSTRLLLQNWWHNKQFVEVDEDYYNSCMGTLALALYVPTPQPHIPPQLDTTNAVFSVSTVDGAGVAGVGCGPARLLSP